MIPRSRKRRGRTQSVPPGPTDGKRFPTAVNTRKRSFSSPPSVSFEHHDVLIPKLLLGRIARHYGHRQEMPIEINTSATEDGPNYGVQRVRLESDPTGWARLWDLTRQFDKARAEDVRDDIDTLLVFAGLFSAIIAALFVESYKNLQEQSQDTTNKILIQMSMQLASLSLNGDFVNSTVPSFTNTPFVAGRPTVLINTLWSLSLVIALITASLAILVKQWLHELMSYETHDPKERLKIRFFREVGLERWKVFAIASLLPLFLQFALVLFFMGFGVFLHDLNTTVGWIVTTVMVLWLGILFFTTLASAFSSQCPYKIPLLKELLRGLRRRSHIILARMSHVTRRLHGTTSQRKLPRLRLWLESATRFLHTIYVTKTELEEDKLRTQGYLDIPTIVCTQDLLRGERLDDSIEECFKGITPWSIYKTFRNSLEGQLPLVHVMVPDIPDGVMRGMGMLVLEGLASGKLSSITVDENCDPYGFSKLYAGITNTLSLSYDPTNNWPLPYQSVPSLVRLIQEGPTSAAFAILILDGIRHRTLKDHPQRLEHLFPYYHDPNIGDRFMTNLFMATKTLTHTLWDRPQPWSDVRKIADCVTRIRQGPDPFGVLVNPDPIPFIYTFSLILYNLVPKPLIERHQDDIIKVLGELASLLPDLDGSSWTRSRRVCVEEICRHLQVKDIADQVLRPKLRVLGTTWNSEWC